MKQPPIKSKAFGRRAVLELLDTDLEIQVIHAARGNRGAEMDEILRLAREKSVRIRETAAAAIERMAPGKVHQGVIALYTPPPLLSIDELLVRERNNPESLIVLLDGVEDPRNLGAVIRSAEAIGAAGVVLRRRRAAGLTPTALKASAGAALLLAIVEVPSIDLAMRRLRESEYWIYGMDGNAKTSLWDLELPTRTAFVLGGEGAGLSRLVRERCDQLLKIPIRGKIKSYNVSVAGAIACGEWLRQMSAKAMGAASSVHS